MLLPVKLYHPANMRNNTNPSNRYFLLHEKAITRVLFALNLILQR